MAHHIRHCCVNLLFVGIAFTPDQWTLCSEVKAHLIELAARSAARIQAIARQGGHRCNCFQFQFDLDRAVTQCIGVYAAGIKDEMKPMGDLELGIGGELCFGSGAETWV